MQKVSFMSGKTIIKEGTRHEYLYVIIRGYCNVVCTKNQEKYLKLQIKDDPTLVKRNEERKSLENPYISPFL